MATFKVTDRVKFISDRCSLGRITAQVPLGHEGVIVAVGAGGWDWIVDVPSTPWRAMVRHSPLTPSQHFADSCQLAPLTDPKADAFLESVKSWKPEPVAPPLPVKEKSRA